jgi:hypothetical protein
LTEHQVEKLVNSAGEESFNKRSSIHQLARSLLLRAIGSATDTAHQSEPSGSDQDRTSEIGDVLLERI